MKQNFDNLYEIDHDYDNESIQNNYYESSLEYLKKFNKNIPYYVLLNYKACMIKINFGQDSKYYKHLTECTSFNKNLVDFFIDNPICSIEVKETYSKELSCCLKDVWINETYFPCEYRKYLGAK